MSMNNFLQKYCYECVQYSADGKELIRFPMDKRGYYVIPNGVEVIGKGAFYGCFCDIELPYALKRIESHAFSDMRSFDDDIYIPEAVTFIDETAFKGEYTSPGMLVKYNTYAHNFAIKHKIRYICIDFDEEAERLRIIEDNSNNYGMFDLINRIKQEEKDTGTSPKVI